MTMTTSNLSPMCCRHDAANLVLLCQHHHRQKTNGLIGRDQLLQFMKFPFNQRSGVSSPLPILCRGDRFKTCLGTNWADNDFNRMTANFEAVGIDDEPLLVVRVEDGNVLLTMNIKNEDDETIFLVDENEMIFTTNLWDVEFVGRTLTMREGRGRFTFQVEFWPPDALVVNRGKFWNAGDYVEITEKGITEKSGSAIGHCLMLNVECGVLMNSTPRPCIWHFPRH